jgi:HSP20 family molecular chaperone IbpA
MEERPMRKKNSARSRTVPFGTMFPEVFPDLDSLDLVTEPALEIFERLIDDFIGKKQSMLDGFKNQIEYPKTDIYLVNEKADKTKAMKDHSVILPEDAIIPILIFEIAVPGMHKDHLCVEFGDKILTISSTGQWRDANGRIDEKTEEDGVTRMEIRGNGKRIRRICKELKRGSFIRKWNLKQYDLDVSEISQISSNLENGILTVRIPLKYQSGSEIERARIEIG